MFDVGANIGQTALSFRNAVPEATIHSFEPVQETFDELKRRVQGMDKVFVHQLAFGSENGFREMFLARNSDVASFHQTDYAAGQRTGAKERVEVMRLDEFCERNAIPAIDLLKIDTEGHDLEVLRGAEALLGSNCIAALFVETAFSLGNNQVQLAEFVTFLEPRGMKCVGIYDQAWWSAKKLHFANVLFVRQDLLN